MLARRRRARARVNILPVPAFDYAPDGAIGSMQVAEVTLPRAELDRLWSPEHLERLARSYWHFINRISLGLLRVLYGPDSREVVLLARPFVLLRFRPPEYETGPERGSVAWPIERGLLVAPNGRGRGYLRLTVERRPERERGAEVTARVSSEVVSFYPLIAGWGWFGRIGRFVYDQTQLRIHVLVTNGFLRSLADLELQESVVGSLSRASGSLSPAASPGHDEP
jgi:hypothetical protein